MSGDGKDTLPPYASGAARLGLLYRLPLTGHERRALIIGSHADGCAAIVAAQPSPTVDVIGPGAASPQSAYDAVMLPGLAPGDTERVEPSPLQTLQEAFRLMVPGGVLVGHMPHLRSLRGIGDSLHARRDLLAWLRTSGLGSPSGCRRALERCGFAEIECYFVEPHVESPMALVPDHRAAARRHFVRSLRRMRGHYPWLGYLGRMLLARAGYGGQMQRHLFFWARRPC